MSVSLPGVKKPLGQYGPAGVADTTGSSASKDDDDDDDDIDLFGSDEEVRFSQIFARTLCIGRHLGSDKTDI